MTDPTVYIESATKALWLVLLLSAAPVLAATVVGLIVSILQATTQIQEQTLTFVPKVIVIGAVLALMGSDMLQKIRTFTYELFATLSAVGHG